MTPEQLITSLETLLADAQKLVTDTNFLSELAAVTAAAKALVPTGTFQGLVQGAKADAAKIQAIFKKL